MPARWHCGVTVLRPVMRAVPYRVLPSTAVAKLSVSLARDDEAWLRRRARRGRQPFSTALAALIADARRAETLTEVLDAHYGRPITAAELANADVELRAALAEPPARPRARRKR